MQLAGSKLITNYRNRRENQFQLTIGARGTKVQIRFMCSILFPPFLYLTGTEYIRFRHRPENQKFRYFFHQWKKYSIQKSHHPSAMTDHVRAVTMPCSSFRLADRYRIHQVQTSSGKPKFRFFLHQWKKYSIQKSHHPSAMTDHVRAVTMPCSSFRLADRYRIHQDQVSSGKPKFRLFFLSPASALLPVSGVDGLPSTSFLLYA